MTTTSVIVAFLLVNHCFSLHLQGLSRAELQFIAKINGIKANGKNAEILAQLEERQQSLVLVSMTTTSDNKVIKKQRALEEKKRELLDQQALQAERTAKVALNDLDAALEALQEARKRHEEALALKEEVEIRIQRCKQETKALDNYRKRRQSEVHHTQLVAKRKRDAIEQNNIRLLHTHTSQQQNNHQTNSTVQPKLLTDVDDTITKWTKTVQDALQGTQQLINRVAENVKNVE